ncbi:DUF4421 family protein [Solitalea koreensis]|uniref:Uncharacterized protein n=1 Tax=Solitalea koreensis TaxID=543615 RepID=A0A521E1W2_9SPHI|nr:DUF4421 family protein [Solitalea koreensis]SMO77872.1 protein of unknown function [Solitalea koreensis]
MPSKTERNGGINAPFSYPAACVQNDWQKKSSGTLLLGGQTYFGKLKGDSTIIPAFNSGSAGIENNRLMRFYEFGPSIGYTYTLVLKQHFYVTGSLSLGLDYVKISLENDI